MLITSSACARSGSRLFFLLLTAFGLVLGLGLHPASAEAEPVLITAAVVASSDAAHFPQDAAARLVRLPDEWLDARSRNERSRWYRIVFDRPATATPDTLLAVYIARV